jgi:TusA-related sulfurtransferase
LSEAPPAVELDLRGVPCPVNWARAKVRLEALARGERVVIVVDDPRSVRDLPLAAEASGHAVTAVAPIADGWRIELEV